MPEYVKSSVYDQIPLFHVVNEDDALLTNDPDAHWYAILKNLPWQEYIEIATDYYDALYHFNQSQRTTKQSTPNEEKRDAKQRLLFERPTINEASPTLHQQEPIDEVKPSVSPLSIAPGIVPIRLGGKKPKCFFALLKCFIGAPLIGFEATPEEVYLLLKSNLSFARACGFVPKGKDDQYWFKYVPSERKLQQFDQIMTDYKLWDKCKQKEVVQNITTAVVKKEKVLVGDTTHFHAYSSYETIPYIDDKGNEKSKSQSKTVKNCQCDDKEKCEHEWELCDGGAGTIVKSNKKYIWGHKAAILGLPLQGIPLDVIAVADAATHDGETLFPHVVDLFDRYPMVKPWIDTVLYDSACDSYELKERFENELNIALRTSLNPRRRKVVVENLPKGINKITPHGNSICNAGFEMDYKGARYDAEKFIYQAPLNENGESVCTTCKEKPTCCPTSQNGRVVQISFDHLPHINSDDPPMAKRFKAMMKQRPTVERMIKQLKCDLGNDKLTKRGNDEFQAYLDKTMIAFHILLRN
jgi:hypothetical protein